ncbi:hydrogenase 2 membrane subunit [Candidatus Magnetomoraceae bacterium gMMP-1]
MQVTKKTSKWKNISNPYFLFFLIPALIGSYYIIIRFAQGIGAVSNLNDSYPWGIWIALDVAVGTGFGCGGYVVAILVYIFNGWKYHRYMRPALLAGLLAYSFAGIAVIIDTGRYWNLVNYLIPSYWQPNSMMFQIALCIFTYNIVLVIEFLPIILETINKKNMEDNSRLTVKIYNILNKVLIVFIALGILLPTMYQIGFGSLMILVGHKLSPLWQSNLLPLLFLITAIQMGFAMVLFEAILAADIFKYAHKVNLLKKIAKMILWLLIAFFIIRISDLFYRQAFAHAFTASGKSLSFWIEMLTLLIPIILLFNPKYRISPKKLFICAILILFNSALFRMNAVLIGFNPGNGAGYFPSGPEIMITLALISLEILTFIFIIKTLPISLRR